MGGGRPGAMPCPAVADHVRCGNGSRRLRDPLNLMANDSALARSAVTSESPLECATVCLAFFVGLLCLVQRRLTHDELLPVVAAALAAGGTVDACTSWGWTGCGRRSMIRLLPTSLRRQWPPRCVPCLAGRCHLFRPRLTLAPQAVCDRLVAPAVCHVRGRVALRHPVRRRGILAARRAI